MNRQTGLEQFAPATDLEIDPGIRRAVLVLRSAGIETFESCQGGLGHAFPDPTVKFHGSAWEGYRALALAMEHGFPVLRMQRVYGVVDAQLEGPWWELVFRTMAQGPAGFMRGGYSARRAASRQCQRLNIDSRYCCLPCICHCRDKRCERSVSSNETELL